MKSNVELLNLYKDEKTLVIGAIGERTGLEPFPTFDEWRNEYVEEYNRTHDVEHPISMEDAVKKAEQELASLEDSSDDDDLLPDEDLEALKAISDPETDEEEDEMTQTATTEATTTAPKAPPVAKKAAPKKPAAKKTATKKAAPKAPAKKAPAAKKEKSKTELAQKLFVKHYGKKPRAFIVEKFVTEIGLTSNGASTYYQRYKKEAESK